MINPTRKPGRPPVDGVAATGHIHIRTTMARKSAYVHAAKPRKLSEWMQDKLDSAAGYKPNSTH